MPKKMPVRRRKAASTGRPPLERLRDTWTATRAALTDAERRMEKQVRGLLKRNKLTSREAALYLKGLRVRAERERKAVVRMVRETVQSTLAALNIPSHQEIAELTRRMEALSIRLDARKR